MRSVIDILDDENFKEWIKNNQAMLALIARQGGSEGFLRSILGFWLQKNNSNLYFISEKGMPYSNGNPPKNTSKKIDLMLVNGESHHAEYMAEFKHNFIGQSELKKKRLVGAVKQLNEYTNLIKSQQKSEQLKKEIIYIVTEFTDSSSAQIPSWAQKYSNMGQARVTNILNSMEKWEENSFPLVKRYELPVNYPDVVDAKIHVFIYGEAKKT